jgi:hypothetical protein
VRRSLAVWMIATSTSFLGACWAGHEAAPPAQPPSSIAALPPHDTATTVRSSGDFGPGSLPALEPASATRGPADDPPYRAKRGDVTAKPAGHHLLAIDPNERAYKVLVPGEYTADGQEYLTRLRICVSEEGSVSRVDIVEPSLPAIDLQLPVVIPRWRYHPYVVEGRPRPFCYVMNYRVG